MVDHRSREIELPETWHLWLILYAAQEQSKGMKRFFTANDRGRESG
jgi:hypothetical protein